MRPITRKTSVNKNPEMTEIKEDTFTQKDEQKHKIQRGERSPIPEKFII